MADMGGAKFLVEPNHSVKILGIQTNIQERKSRIVRLTQDIEDLQLLAIKQKEAEIEMLKLDLIELEKRLDMVNPTDATIVEIKKRS